MKIITSIVLSLLASYVVAENCDYQGHNIYEDLGCKPITKEGHACPIRYDCNFEVKNNTCTFRGKSVQVRQTLTEEDTYSACVIDCHCEDSDKFECAELNCPEWMGGNPVKPGCYRKYELDKCCSVGQNCPEETGLPFECKVNGVLWVEFEKFFVENTCLDCVCNKGYKGVNEAPFCTRRKCVSEIKNSKEIHRYCAPHYGGSEERTLCCPDGWVCPSENVKSLPPNPKADSTSDLTCKFGDSTLKLGERIKGQFKWYDDSIRDSQCECIVPPLLTCRDIPRPISTSTSSTSSVSSTSSASSTSSTSSTTAKST